MLLRCLLLLLPLLRVQAGCTCSCCLGGDCTPSTVGTLPPGTAASECIDAVCSYYFPQCPSAPHSGIANALYTNDSGPSPGPIGAPTSGAISAQFPSGSPMLVNAFTTSDCSGPVAFSQTLSPGCQSLTVNGTTIFGNPGCQAGIPTFLLCQDSACLSCSVVPLGSSGTCGASFLGVFDSMEAICGDNANPSASTGPSDANPGTSMSGTPVLLEGFTSSNCSGKAALSQTFSSGCQSLTVNGTTIFGNLACQAGIPTFLLCQDSTCFTCGLETAVPSGSCGTSFSAAFLSIKPTCISINSNLGYGNNVGNANNVGNGINAGNENNNNNNSSNLNVHPIIKIIIICFSLVAGICCPTYWGIRHRRRSRLSTPGAAEGEGGAEAVEPAEVACGADLESLDSVQKGSSPQANPLGPCPTRVDTEDPSCTHCGTPLQKRDASFCLICGAPLLRLK